MIHGKMHKGKLVYYSRWWMLPPFLTSYYSTVLGIGRRCDFMNTGLVEIIPAKIWVN